MRLRLLRRGEEQLTRRARPFRSSRNRINIHLQLLRVVMLLPHLLVPLMQLFQLLRVVLDVAPRAVHRADAASTANAHSRSRCEC